MGGHVVYALPKKTGIRGRRDGKLKAVTGERPWGRKTWREEARERRQDRERER